MIKFVRTILAGYYG